MAFTTPLGQYEPMVISFGLRNAPGTFMHTMNRLFHTLQNNHPGEIQVYMDDILIAMNNDVEYYQQIIWKVLKIMKKESFFLKAAKCEFKKMRVEYLGLILDGNTIQPDPVKIASLKEWP